MTRGLGGRRALVSALGKSAQVGAALDAFREMQRLRLTIPPAVYHELIGACGAAGDGDGADEVFCKLRAHKGVSEANPASPLPLTPGMSGCERLHGKAL
jgi:pentatricopeptide repeat protein